MKRVLLTGGSGFIGRNTIYYLLEKGYEVHIVYRNKILKEYTDYAEWHHCDLLNYRMQRILLNKISPTHLLHFAWEATPNVYKTSKENLNWVSATEHLLINFTKSGGYRAVIAGTCFEYDWKFKLCKEKLTPLKPTTLYGECKKNMQQIAEQLLYKNMLSIAWGRIFFLYGPYENKSRLVASVINSLLKGNPALCSHGNQTRDFMFVKDISSAFVSLLDSDVESTINIASGVPVKLKDVINMIAKKIGWEDLVKLGAIPTSDNEQSIIIADTSRLNNELEWFPKYTLSKGLEETINWWKNNF